MGDGVGFLVHGSKGDALGDDEVAMQSSTQVSTFLL
jgi:hypothetical protein